MQRLGQQLGSQLGSTWPRVSHMLGLSSVCSSRDYSRFEQPISALRAGGFGE